MEIVLSLTVIDWMFLVLVAILAAFALLIDRGVFDNRRWVVIGVLSGTCAAMIAIFFSVEDRSSFFFGEIFEDEEKARQRRAMLTADPRDGKRPPRDATGSGDGAGRGGAAQASTEVEADGRPNDLTQDGDGGGRRGTRADAKAAAADVGPAGAFRDCPVCPQMVPIRPGTFTMGSAPGDAGHAPYEAPSRLVTIARPFALGRFEVKAFEYAAFVSETGHASSRECVVGGRRVPQRDFRAPGIVQSGSHPVVCVTYDDALAYAGWLSAKTGKRYRLPSESEWEHAARAGAALDYPTGKTVGSAKAHFKASSKTGPNAKTSATHTGTLPVGSFAPNAYGLQDMAGNVWELVADCWQADARRATVTAAAIGATRSDCSHHVIKGGAWYSEAIYLRAASRWSQPAQTAGNGVGFRIARDAQ